MFRQIRLRLTAWYVAVLALILLATGAGLYVAIYEELFNLTDSEVRQAAEFAASNYIPYLYGEFSEHGKAEDDDEPLALTILWTYIETPAAGSINSNPNLTFFPDRASLDKARRLGRPIHTTLKRTVGGRRETVRLYTLPVYTSGGRYLGVVQAGKPITPLLEMFRQLFLTILLAMGMGLILATGGGLFLADRALVPIRQAFRRQREFVADASHELRTPMAIIRASAELLDRELAGAPGDTRELVGNVLSESDRMGRLVEDLLTLARADSGEMDLERKSFDLAQVAEGVARKVGLLAREKGVALDTHLPPALPVTGDATRLEQLLLILLDNAVKYTPAGGRVTLTANPHRDRVELAVSDTGIGIPPEDRERIFDRFYRVDKARSRAAGGTGLGLAIARWIVDAHGGAIRVDSTPGQGSTFTVSLPV